MRERRELYKERKRKGAPGTCRDVYWRSDIHEAGERTTRTQKAKQFLEFT